MIKINEKEILQSYIFLLIINYTIEGFLKSFPVNIGGISILWIISSVWQWICFLLLFFFYNRHFPEQGIIAAAILFIMLFGTCLLHKQNLIIYPSLITEIFQGGCIILGASYKNSMKYVGYAMQKAAIITFIILCLYPFFCTKEIFLTTNYMVFSNGMIVSVIFFAYKFFKGYYIYLLPAVIGFMEILLCGSRSPLLSLILFTVLYFILFNKKNSRKKIVFFTLVLFLFIVFLMIISNKELLKILYEWILNTTGKYSRTLYELIYGQGILDLHGRENIYTLFFCNITHFLLNGYGLAGDRIFLLDTVYIYAHNIFVEIWLEFGILAGTGLIIVLLAVLLYPFKMKIKFENIIFYTMLLSIVIGKLLLSNSWIQEPLFYLLIGLSLSAKTKSK